MSGAPVVLAVRLGTRGASALVDGALRTSFRSEEAGCDGIEGLSAVIARQLRQARDTSTWIRGVAFALPSETHWRDLAAKAADRFYLPCTTQAVPVAALEAEARDGDAGMDHAALLDTDELRLALRLNGRNHGGANGAAGHIAHLGLDRAGTIPCVCGLTGCLGALLTMAGDAPAPPLPSGIGHAPSRALGWLAVAGIALVNVLNPARLVVQGNAVSASGALDWFSAAVRHGCLSATRAGLLGITRARDDSALIGAAARFSLPHQAAPLAGRRPSTPGDLVP